MKCHESSSKKSLSDPTSEQPLVWQNGRRGTLGSRWLCYQRSEGRSVRIDAATTATGALSMTIHFAGEPQKPTVLICSYSLQFHRYWLWDTFCFLPLKPLKPRLWNEGKKEILSLTAMPSRKRSWSNGGPLKVQNVMHTGVHNSGISFCSIVRFSSTWLCYYFQVLSFRWAYYGVHWQ